MARSGKFLRKVQGGYMHQCPGCDEMHVIYTDHKNPNHNWEFNGDLEKPTFNPSVKITIPECTDPDFKSDRTCCHYFIRDGMIEFCSDSTHALSGQKVKLPEFSK